VKEIVCGLTINYEVYGEGPPALCLHGWNERGKVFQTPSYKKLLQGYTVYALDLPGFGKSQNLKKYDFAELMTIIDAFIMQMGLTDFCLVGQCMGGIIALDYTIKHREKVTKLILVETMIYFPIWMRLLFVDFLNTWVLRFMMKQRLGFKLLSLHKALRPNRKNRLFGMIKKTDIAQSLNYIKLLKEYARYDHLKRLKGIKTPVVIIMGDNTFRQVRKTAADLKRLMDNVQIIRVPAKSHFVFEE
jgi:pimeloyl-ACP methyl ester carboxylesterase